MLSSQSLEGSNYTKMFWKFSCVLLLWCLSALCLSKGCLGPGLSHVQATTIASCAISAGAPGRRELRGEIKAAGIYQAIRAHCQGKRRNWGEDNGFDPRKRGLGVRKHEVRLNLLLLALVLGRFLTLRGNISLVINFITCYVLLLWSWFKFTCVTAEMIIAKRSCDAKQCLHCAGWSDMECSLELGWVLTYVSERLASLSWKLGFKDVRTERCLKRHQFTLGEDEHLNVNAFLWIL